MADKLQIRINSILGGQAPTSMFAREDQFLMSSGIDPSVSLSAQNSIFYDDLPNGSITPVGVKKQYSPNDAILWMVRNPKTRYTYMVDASGSAYSMDYDYSFTILNDDTALNNSSGNGCAYYDNYVYFAKDTTIARYGPLDGTPTWDGDYWVTTLGLTQLTNTSNYPKVSGRNIPNHYLHRHSDGRLYIADVVDNTGTLHYIQTTKTTVEGDTNNGSKYDAVNVGFGLWPTCIESYGEQLVIGLYEGGENTSIERKYGNAKIAFWTPDNENIDKIIWEEFTDSVISRLKNLNGVLYIVSGHSGGSEMRISKFIGGYSIQEMLFAHMTPPLPGAVDGYIDRLFFGATFNYRFDTSENRAGIFSFGLSKSELGRGLFNMMPCSGDDNNNTITAIINYPENNDYNRIVSAWDGTIYGIDTRDSNMSYTYGNPFWMSQTYKIGQKYKITKLALNFTKSVGASTVIEPFIYTDNLSGETSLTTINYTNYPDKRRVVIRPENLTGEHNFNLFFRWSNQRVTPIALPITIEYELIDD